MSKDRIELHAEQDGRTPVVECLARIELPASLMRIPVSAFIQTPPNRTIPNGPYGLFAPQTLSTPPDNPDNGHDQDPDNGHDQDPRPGPAV